MVPKISQWHRNLPWQPEAPAIRLCLPKFSQSPQQVNFLHKPFGFQGLNSVHAPLPLSHPGSPNSCQPGLESSLTFCPGPCHRHLSQSTQSQVLFQNKTKTTKSPFRLHNSCQLLIAYSCELQTSLTSATTHTDTHARTHICIHTQCVHITNKCVYLCLGFVDTHHHH